MTDGHEDEPLDDRDQLEQVWDLGLHDLFGGEEKDAAETMTESAPGDHCGRFLLIEEIAQGGMGRVFKALDEKLDRPVAVKILRERLIRDDQMTARFLEEARIAAQLQHPGIVPVYDVGLDSQARPWFSMKLVEGRTLGELIGERGSADRELSRFLGIFAAVCQAVGYAHRCGVIHRDLKPGNVMVGSFGEVQVLDWGFAKIIQAVQSGSATEAGIAPSAERRPTSGSDSSRSVSGSVLGTPRYMSPEQARGEIEKLDERTDVFALGAILCEILTAQTPWGRSSTEDPIKRAARGDLSLAHAALDACNADCELIDLARSCLEVEADSRPIDAGAVAHLMGDYLAAAEARTRSARVEAETALASAAHERRARYLTIALGLVLVAIAAGGVFFVWRRDADRRDDLARRRDRLRAVLDDARDHARDKQWPLAHDAVERGRMVLGDRPPKSLLAEIERARETISERQAAWSLAELERERQRQFRSALETIRLSPMDEPGKGGNEYADCFAAFGHDVESQSSELSYLEIAKLPGEFQEAIRLALDDWASRERAVEARLEAGGVRRSQRLLELAQFLDRDPWRRRLRAAVIDRDEAELDLIAAEAQARAIDPKDAVLLATTIQRAGDVETALAILRRSWTRYPGDVWVNHHIALFLESGQRKPELRKRDAELALRHAHMALALAPDSPFLRDNVIEHLIENDGFDELSELMEVWRDELSDDRIVRLSGRLDHVAALRLLEASRAERPRSIEIHLRLVSEHLEVADFAAAEEAALEGIATVSADDRVTMTCTLADLLLDAGRIDDAAKVLAEEVEAGNDDEELRRMNDRLTRWRRALTMGTAAEVNVPGERARLLQLQGEDQAALSTWLEILEARATDRRPGRGPGPGPGLLRGGRGLGPPRGMGPTGDGRRAAGLGRGQGLSVRQVVLNARPVKQDALAAVLQAAANDPARAQELIDKAAEAVEQMIPEGGIGHRIAEDLRISAALKQLRVQLPARELASLEAALALLLEGGRQSLDGPGESDPGSRSPESPPPPEDEGPPPPGIEPWPDGDPSRRE